MAGTFSSFSGSLSNETLHFWVWSLFWGAQILYPKDKIALIAVDELASVYGIRFPPKVLRLRIKKISVKPKFKNASYNILHKIFKLKQSFQNRKQQSQIKK